jgi:hypothetical protein
MKETATHLTATIKQALPLLMGMDEAHASTRPAQGKWSPKEIIGHLVDSAGNNQQKFVRAMREDGVQFPNYEQDFWVSAQHYNEEPWNELILLWEHSNYHLAHVIHHIPAAALKHTISIGASGVFTLEFMAKDYTEHLKHHLKSLFPQAGFLSNYFKMAY